MAPMHQIGLKAYKTLRRAGLRRASRIQEAFVLLTELEEFFEALCFFAQIRVSAADRALTILGPAGLNTKFSTKSLRGWDAVATVRLPEKVRTVLLLFAGEEALLSRYLGETPSLSAPLFPRKPRRL
jgi:hypothetical protein